MLDYEELDKRYMTRKELEEMWEFQKRDNRSLINSIDAHLRSVEFQIQKLELLINSLTEMWKVRGDSIVKMEEKTEELDKRSQLTELGLEGVKGDYINLHRTLFGDATSPDAPESVMSVMKRRSEKADKQHTEIMDAVSALDSRLEDVETFIAFRRQVESFVTQRVLKTTAGKVLTATIVSFILARIGAPDFMDHLGMELINFINAITSTSP